MRVINTSRHKFTKSEEEIVHHLHGNQVKIEQNPERWEHLGNFLDFMAKHQESNIFLYVVAPLKFLLYAMSYGYHFYFFTNNGTVEVYEVKNRRIGRLYQRKKTNKRTRYMRN